ncbi:MAG: hypothetical protein M1579_01200 [Gammaproteobacteria bacterium]|nr:hypothetical protein [Gammaproteobacteria bacterium]
MSDTLLIRRLMMGEIICMVTDEAAVDRLQNPAIMDHVNTALAYVGMKLSSNEVKSYFYASYADLSKTADAQHLKQRLQSIVKIMHPLFQFIELITKANNEDSYPTQGHTYLFSQLLMTIENNDALADMLTNLSNKSLFKSARAKSNTNDRLRSLLTTMVNEGLLYTSEEGLRYVVTGQFDYYLSIYHQIVALDSPEVMAEVAEEQVDLALFA